MNNNQLQYFAELEATRPLTAVEQETLDQLLAADPANATAYAEMLEILLMSTEVLDQVDAQTDAEWEALLGQMENAEETVETPVVPMRRKPMRWVGMAAAIALLAVVGFWASGIFGPDATQSQTLVFAADGQLDKQVTLEDGSVIQLKPGARLSLAEDFNTTERRMTLEGQAYFEVHHDPTRPFIVTAGKTETKVLGTRFHVNARHGAEAIKVSVEEGKVGFSAPGSDEGEILVANEAAVYQAAAGTISKVKKLDPSDVHPETEAPRLVFKDTPLRDLVPELETFYGVELTFPDALMGNEISATFEKGEPNEEMAVVLKLILGCEFVQEGNQFSFSQ